MSHEIDLNGPAAVAVRLSYCEQGLAKLTEIVEGNRKVNESVCKTLALQQESLLAQQRETERQAETLKSVAGNVDKLQQAAWMVTGGWKGIGIAAVIFVGITKLIAFAFDYLPKLVG